MPERCSRPNAVGMEFHRIQTCAVSVQSSEGQYLMEQTLLSQYFWLFCGVWVGLGNLVWIRFRLRSRIVSGEFSRAEVDSYTRNLALWVGGTCLGFWLMQHSAKNAGPGFMTWPNPQREIAIFLTVFVWAALMYWVFVRRGADVLSKFLCALSYRGTSMYSPLVVKLVTIAGILAGAFELFSGGMPHS